MLRRSAGLLLLALAWPGSPPGVEVDLHAIGALHPRISPDGRDVAFSYQGSIWRASRDGGGMKRLTRGPGFDTCPAWSPDGKTIAFLGGWMTGPVRLADAESGEVREFKAAGDPLSGPLLFHPDGKRLLANRQKWKAGMTLFWVNLEDGRSEPITESRYGLSTYALSPDGSRIALAVHQDILGEQEGFNGPQADLWVMPSSGGAPEKIGRTRSRVYQMAWRDKEIVYSSDQGGAHDDLFSISLDDPTHAHRLTNGTAGEDYPSFSADGAWMAYSDNREGAAAIAVRRGTDPPERFVSIRRMDFGAPTGTLKVSAFDAKTGRPVVARLSVQEEGGKGHVPPGFPYRLEGDLLYFYGKDAPFAVPAGKYAVRGFRGMEYGESRQDVEVKAGETVEVRVDLKRWIDSAEAGWYSGESHIHANYVHGNYGNGAWYSTPEVMRLHVQGEDLNAANFVIANSGTDGIFDREFWRGEPDPVSTPEHVLYWNEEFRATLWGHMTLWNLKHLVEPLMTGFKDTTNPYDAPTNADIADHVHAQGGHVTFTHPLFSSDPFTSAYSAKELPVDVALGKIDSLDINGWYASAVPLWYKLLNCGFRLPASAGTDAFVNQIGGRRLGVDRAYVRVEGPFTYGAWVEGLKAGRSFVTNGPWLEFEAGGKRLGETVELEGPGEVRVAGTARAPFPLERIEVVRNGEVVATGTDGRVDQAVRFESGGWLSLRVYGKEPMQAHTSPIYVEVAGKGISSPEEAKYFLTWIDRLEARLRERDRLPTDAQRNHVYGLLEAAREVYRRIAGR